MSMGHAWMVWLVSFCALFLSTPMRAQDSVPPPMEQMTADCARPVYASDQLVCGDQALQLLDARLSAMLGQNQVTPISAFYESDDAWFKRRSRCAFEVEHKSCLIEAYSDRIAVVEALSADTASPKTATCKILPNIRRVLIGTTPGGQIIVRDSRNVLIGVASEKAKTGIWKPMLAVATSRNSYQFESQDGRRFMFKLR
ncbi:MAG: hypothetical protein ACK4ZE_01095 [Sphingorhabdus sp.]